MQAALFDTSIYVTALRRGHEGVVTIRRLDSGSIIWLSAVVLEELYAGTSARDRQVIQRLERDFRGAERILVPSLNDWTQAGEVLGRLAAKYGYEKIGQGRLTNDALIAMGAGRAGMRVLTANQRDFRRLAEFRAFQWEVVEL